MCKAQIAMAGLGAIAVRFGRSDDSSGLFSAAPRSHPVRPAGLASVRIGEVLIQGVTVWQSGRGRIRVYFPSWKAGYRWEEAIDLPNELRSEIETDVISRYKSEKQKAKKAEQEKQGGR